MNREQLISAAVEAPKIIDAVPFSEIVKITSGHSVVPLDIGGNSQDKELFDKISASAKQYIELCRRTRRRLQGKRVNEVGNAIEEEFIQELQRNELRASKLGEAGYPDIAILDRHNRVNYLESKATSTDWDSTFRAFYYTTGKKIREDARHLLIGWRVREERDKYWEIVGCRLVDLSTLSLRLKSEFNAGNDVLYENVIFEFE